MEPNIEKLSGADDDVDNNANCDDNDDTIKQSTKSQMIQCNVMDTRVVKMTTMTLTIKQG